MSVNDLQICISLNTPATLNAGVFDCPGDGSMHSSVSERYGSIKSATSGLRDDYGHNFTSNFNFIDFDLKGLIDDGTLSGGDVM